MPVEAPVTRTDRIDRGYRGVGVTFCCGVNEPSHDDAERKQVTVLFADVSGSMDLAEQEDPEEWRKIMQRFFSLLAETVTRFEGTVDKFTGDGIMAIFGAPVAHEDHARRACYAALQMLDDVAEYAAELRREKGLNFSTRIGINSGEVVAGAIGEGELLHRDRPHGRPRAADGGAGRARQGLPDREHRRAGARIPRPQRPRRVRDQGREPPGRGLRAGRGRPGALAPRPRPRARLLALRRPRARDRRRWKRRWSGRRAARRARSASSPNRGSARAASTTSSSSAAAATGSRSSRPRARPTASRSPSCRSCRCCAPSSGSATPTPSSWRGRRSPGGRCCSTPASPTICR